MSGSGDLLTAWDVSAFGERDGETEVLSKVDAHWHDITGVGLWTRTVDGRKEPWIVTASLDGTLRRWKLSRAYSTCIIPLPSLIKRVDIINQKYEMDIRSTYGQQENRTLGASSGMKLSAEEEAELAALMSDDE